MFIMSLKELFEMESLHFVLFGGKGGVGKTTSAAAAAIWAAENLSKKILIISTDPAHSLGDSLGQILEPGVITEINDIENLWGLEISPEMEQSELSNVLSMMPEDELPLGQEMSELAGLNPPGIDEALAFGKVLEFIDNSDYDLIIFDTAPTGHTLRLLSIPDMLSGWMGKLIKFKLKIGKLFGALKSVFKKNPDRDSDLEGNPLESIIHLKESIEKAKSTLMDPDKTSFIICTIAEIMSIYETERLLSYLLEYQIPTDRILVNQLYPRNIECKFCQMRREMQQENLKQIKDLYANSHDIIEIPLFDSEIRKKEGLKKYSSYLFE
ncbi:MAG: AAA family ATPase [Candidatus Lokiarchaeota archaeon]|nr:AAA family ATPase [Candidatus Lokiarchaeota archaeon]